MRQKKKGSTGSTMVISILHFCLLVGACEENATHPPTHTADASDSGASDTSATDSATVDVSSTDLGVNDTRSTDLSIADISPIDLDVDDAAPADQGASVFAGIAAPMTIGRNELSVPWEGDERTVIVEIPEGFDPTELHPVLFVFHGGGSKASRMYTNRANLREIAGDRQIITVFPQGTSSGGDSYGWNWAGLPTNTADDVGFVSALIDWMIEKMPVNSERIYTSGFSAGGGLSQRVAAHRPDLIAAAISVCMSTGFFVSTPLEAACPQARRSCREAPVAGVASDRFGIGDIIAPVPVFLIRGGEDVSVCPNGTCSRTARDYDTVEEQIEKWLTSNGCDGAQVETDMLSDTTLMRRYESCSSNSPVHAVFISDLEHAWPNSADQRIVDFLTRFALD
jgi:poly(3-hydroxybutyrate) depolymerase